MIIRLSKTAASSESFAESLGIGAHDDLVIPVYSERARILARNPVDDARIFSWVSEPVIT